MDLGKVTVFSGSAEGLLHDHFTQIGSWYDGVLVQEWESELKKASQVEMGGALLSGGHQSSSPFIVGFAGFILAQEALRRAHVSPRIKGSSRLFFAHTWPPTLDK